MAQGRRITHPSTRYAGETIAPIRRPWPGAMASAHRIRGAVLSLLSTPAWESDRNLHRKNLLTAGNKIAVQWRLLGILLRRECWQSRIRAAKRELASAQPISK